MKVHQLAPGDSVARRKLVVADKGGQAKASGFQNPGALAPDSAPSLTEADPDRWTDWHGDDDGEPPPVGWSAPPNAPQWADLAPWEQRGVRGGDAELIASSRRWSGAKSFASDLEPGHPPPERWRERAAPLYRRYQHWRALTPVDQEQVLANLAPLPAERAA